MKKCIKKVAYFLMGFLMKNGAQMEAQGTSNDAQNGGISWTFRDPPPGALQGRVWGGFCMDLGTILEGFWTDLEAGGSPNRDEKE